MLFNGLPDLVQDSLCDILYRILFHIFFSLQKIISKKPRKEKLPKAKELWINPEHWEVLAEWSSKNQRIGVNVTLLIIEGYSHICHHRACPGCSDLPVAALTP